MTSTRIAPGDVRIARYCLQKRAAALASACACLALLWQGSAHAQFRLQPYAEVGYQYDSNLFALPSDAATLGYPQGIATTDSTYKALAGLHGDFRWPLEEVTLDAEGRRLSYD